MPHRRDDGNHSSKLPIRLGVETMHIAAPNGDHGSTPNGGGKIDGRQCSIQDDIHQNEFLLKRAYRAGWTEDIILTKGFQLLYLETRIATTR
jgi:hypothetical protein